MKIVKSIVIVLASLVMNCSLANAAAVEPEQVTHFDLMPKVVALSDGTLAAYFLDHSGPGLSDDTPDQQEIIVRYSTDRGATWSEQEHLFDLPSEAGGFGYFLAMADRTDEVHLLLLCDANTGAVRLLPSDRTPRVQPLARQSLDVWHVKSHAGRTVWGEPRKIWTGRAADIQSVAQLKSGRIVLPLAYLVDRNWGRRGEGAAAFTYFGNFDTTALYSDDSGETWTVSSSVLRTPVPNLSAYGAVEPVVAQLSDGRVWMVLRTQTGRFYESFSSDDGATWSPARPSPILSSDSPAALIGLPDGRLVMLWNNCQRYGYAQGARNVLHAAISSDDGATWQGYREILRDPKRGNPPPPSGDHGVSYPFAIALDNTIYYSLWIQTVGGRTLERFSIDWLLADSRSDTFADGLAGWSTFGTRGVEIVDDDDAVDGKVLRIAKEDAEWPASAVWNFPASSAGELAMRIRLQPGVRDFQIVLTDHFSVPADLEDRFNSLFHGTFGSDADGSTGAAIEADKWFDLHLTWDTSAGTCRVTIDGETIGELPLQAVREHGVSYLRLRADGPVDPSAGILIDSVQAAVRVR